MAYLELVAACLIVHSYSVEEDANSDFSLAGGPTVAVAGVYTVAVGLVAVVALVDFE